MQRWGDVYTSQGTPRIAAATRSWEGQGTHPPTASEGTSPANTLISGFPPPVLMSKLHSLELSYGSSGKLTVPSSPGFCSCRRPRGHLIRLNVLLTAQVSPEALSSGMTWLWAPGPGLEDFWEMTRHP